MSLVGTEILLRNDAGGVLARFQSINGEWHEEGELIPLTEGNLLRALADLEGEAIAWRKRNG